MATYPSPRGQSDGLFLKTLGDAAVWGSGGGGGGGGGQEQIQSSDYTTIANDDIDYLLWDTSTGDALLDLSDPQHPTAVADGIYAVTVTVTASDVLTAGGAMLVTLTLDAFGLGSSVQINYLPPTSDGPAVPLSLTSFVSAGGEINVQVLNRDGASSRGFAISYSTIQLIG